jgi:hypothetical protein
LKGVFRVLIVPQDPPTDAENEGPVSSHQKVECRFVAVVQETLQQVPIGKMRRRTFSGNFTELVNDRFHGISRHRMRT